VHVALQNNQSGAVEELGKALRQSALTAADKLTVFAGMSGGKTPLSKLKPAPSASTIDAYEKTATGLGIVNVPVIRNILKAWRATQGTSS
jgi:hypothetical protein